MGKWDVPITEADVEPIILKNPKKPEKTYNLDRSLTEKIDPLIKFKVINDKFSMRKLLHGLGYDTSRGSMYCPFHNDELTGKPSAVYHSNDDTLYCFSESKTYSAYHALKILYNEDTDKIFRKIWIEMPEDQRHFLMDKREGNWKGNLNDNNEDEEMPAIWKQYEPLLRMFRQGKVNYQQFKAGLYKVLIMLSKEEKQEVEGMINGNEFEHEEYGNTAS